MVDSCSKQSTVCMWTICFIILRSGFKLSSLPFRRILLPPSSWDKLTLKMYAAGSSRTSASINWTTWCHIPCDYNLYTAVRNSYHQLLSVCTCIFYCMYTYVSVTYNVSVQYITWSLIPSLLYMYFICMPLTPPYIRWVGCSMDIIYLWQVIARKSVRALSGIARFFGARGEESQWWCVTEIMNFKKTHTLLLNFLLTH